MSNMSYCRFRNTSKDLWDCLDYINETEGLSKEEIQARKELIKIARILVDETENERI